MTKISDGFGIPIEMVDEIIDTLKMLTAAYDRLNQIVFD